MDRSIEIVRQLEKVFEPYCTMLIEVKEKKKQLPSQCFGKENKNTKKTIKYFLGVARSFLRGFSLFAGEGYSGTKPPAKIEG